MRLLVAGALALSLLAVAAADPWAALGLPRDADEAQIKRAYRTLALKLHPDKVRAHRHSHRRRSRRRRRYTLLAQPPGVCVPA